MPAAPPLTLVQFPGLSRGGTLSPLCGKVQMALRFKGLDFEVRNVNTPGQVKRYNARGRVPVLLVGDEAIVDSSDILTALEERFPDPPLEPAEPEQRALVKVLEDWADEVIYFYGVWMRFGVEANFERLRREAFGRMPVPVRWIAPSIAKRIARRRARDQGTGLKGDETVLRELREALATLAALLGERSFLVGDQLTRADLAVAAVLDQMAVERLSPDAAAAIGAEPAVAAWRARVHERAPSAAG